MINEQIASNITNRPFFLFEVKPQFHNRLATKVSNTKKTIIREDFLTESIINSVEGE